MTPGTYAAMLTVTDRSKSTDKTIRIIVHPQGGMAPVVEKPVADPGRGHAPLPVRFEAAATDPDGPESQLRYRWDFGDDNGTQFGRVVTHTYMEAGRLRRDGHGDRRRGRGHHERVDQDHGPNPPGNVAPTVQAAADPHPAAAPLRVQFSAAASDPDGDATDVQVGLR